MTTTPSGHRRHFKSPKRQRMVADYAENVAAFPTAGNCEVHPIFLSGGGQAFFLVAKSNRLKKYMVGSLRSSSAVEVGSVIQGVFFNELWCLRFLFAFVAVNFTILFSNFSWQLPTATFRKLSFSFNHSCNGCYPYEQPSCIHMVMASG